jgi:polar amino acid transport system substrate-binding protein
MRDGHDVRRGKAPCCWTGFRPPPQRIIGTLAGLLLTLGVLWPAPGQAQRVLVLNAVTEPPLTTGDRRGFLDVVATEAFRRLDIELRLVHLPPERGLLNVNAGIDDGELMRIEGMEKNYPNLRRVPEKIYDMDFVAFARDPGIPSRWDSILTRPVGLIKGWKIYEAKTAGAASINTVDGPDQLFRMLQLNRIDVALYERWMGLDQIKRHALAGVHILEPPLMRREMFIYLHKKHEALIPRLAEILRALKHESFYQRVFREKLMPLMTER